VPPSSQEFSLHRIPEFMLDIFFEVLKVSRAKFMDKGSDNPKPPHRSEIKPGSAVWIIERENYGTNTYTQGIVKDILTPQETHPRGIKVRLTNGTVGRVQWLMGD